ncbi:MAG TPA: glycosyl hydrolase family protein [Acidobacteriaceae bacterium]
MQAIQGKVHGGPQPIQGGIVNVYATQSGGYGGAALALAEPTTTDSGGNFTLTPDVGCPLGQYAYVTIAAGNTGGSATNSNSLLMAALGKCSDLYNGTTYIGQFVWVDELTTIASAYALGNFLTIDSSNATPVVNISAPATNNSLTPCIAGVGSCTITAANGLGHAFANATNLVNITNGQAYATLPSPANTSGIVPAALINLMGNILQSCVNTTGMTGTNTATSNDGSGCGKLFSLTTPPLAGSAVPDNTLQAMVNLVKYPNINTATWNLGCTSAGSGTTTGTACLFNLATGNAYYLPTLVSAPSDWSIAVVIPQGQGAVTTGCSGTCSGLTYPWSPALDINDNVYVTNNDSSNQVWENVLGFAYNGVPLWSTPQNFAQKAVKFIATDGLGNVLTADNSTGANQVITIYSGATGTVLGSPILTAVDSPFGIAVDPYNNIWYSSSSIGVQNIQELAYTGTTGGVPQYTAVTFPHPPNASQGINQIALDSGLNIWGVGNATSASSTFFFPNTGTVSAPAYAGTMKSAATAGSTAHGYGIAPDGSGNAWEVNGTNLYEIASVGTGDSATLVAGSGISIGADYPRYGVMDGDNVFWTVDYANGGGGSVSAYDTIHAYARGIVKPCRVNATTRNTCGSGSSQTAGTALYAPRGLALDSAGDIWVTSATNGNLVEIIGSAAPAWPAASQAMFGRPGGDGGAGIVSTAALSPSSATFPSTNPGSSSSPQTFTFTNTGNVNLTISSVSVSLNNFSYTDTCTGTVTPGNSCIVYVTFTPTVGGTITGTLTIASSSISNPTLTSALTGTGISRLTTLSTPSGDLGPSNVGYSAAARYFDLTNTGTGSISITSIAATGDFFIGSGSNQCGTTLAVGDDCYVRVFFIPTATGARTGTLTIKTNSTNNPTYTVALTGTGLSLPTPVSSTIAAVAVTASSTPTSIVPKNFVSFSLNVDVVTRQLGYSPNNMNPIFYQVTKNITDITGIPMLDRFLHDTAGVTVTSSYLAIMAQFYKDTGTSMFVGINMSEDDPSGTAAGAAKTVAALPAAALVGLELGNEPDLYVSGGYRTSPYGYTQYLADETAYATAVLPQTSGIKFAAPVWTGGSSSFVDNLDDFITARQGDLSMVNIHYYSGTGLDTVNPSNYLLTDAALTRGQNYPTHSSIANAVTAAKNAGIQHIRVGEINSITNGGLYGISDTFSSALWTMDIGMGYAKAGFTGVNYFLNPSVIDAYNALDFNYTTSGSTRTYTLRYVAPEYYGMLMLATMLQNDAGIISSPITVVKTNGDTPTIKAWATKDGDGTIRVLLINKDETTGGPVTLTMAGRGNATVTRLSAPAWQSTWYDPKIDAPKTSGFSGVNINGQTFDNSTDGKITGTAVPESIAPVSGIYTVNLPVANAVILTIPQ